MIINLVMGSMFLVLPTFWLGALAGGVKVAQDSGGKAGGIIGR
ncbi:Uncharacterised protein [Enterobacter hormaechei]|nr:Uncharacterised protein [Enterobacter hormaechei]CZU97641.1 Uncharacterised protein [Enterobacter hormaechei]CZW58648.1 Uncharacterised protein [Enterobacter hormaechei]CZY99847.1 Uncharacterised protein [Enterobacter hormaechei]CZZ40446.1 Uncharacterised protein [Enterobacter hormaechei]